MWVSCEEQYFPIHQMKPCLVDWRKLVFKEKIVLFQRNQSSLLIMVSFVHPKYRPADAKGRQVNKIFDHICYDGCHFHSPLDNFACPLLSHSYMF